MKTRAPGLDLLEPLLERCASAGASDLHISVACKPMLRQKGSLTSLDDQAPLTPDAVLEMVQALANEAQIATLADERNLDLAHSLPSGERFRINIYFERGNPALAVRWLDNACQSLSQLNLPPQLAELARLQHGLVLITGPTGSGKSTTLSSLLHQINEERACHILTIEDPVEYVHVNRRALIHQRELGDDTPSFAAAVRAAMREDPDVILVGEMRDLETMRASLMAAETGHLVFSTLHTGDAVGVLERMVGAFPGEEQESIRHQLSMVLRAVVAQHLLPSRTGPGRVPVVEILRVTAAVGNLIRTGRSQQLVSAMESGQSQGMQTIDAALAQQARERRVDYKIARSMTRDPRLFEDLVMAPAINARTGGA